MTEAQMPPSRDPRDPPGSEQEEEAPTPTSKARVELILDDKFEFNPGSLVGSWCHRVENAEIVWDGAVVAEPQPGLYLIQVRKGLDGLERSQAQVLMAAEQMVAKDEGYEWRFYDSRDEMVEAYAEHTITREAFT